MGNCLKCFSEAEDEERLIAESDLDSDVGSELLDDGPIENEGDLQIKKMTEEILSQIISNEGHNMGQREIEDKMRKYELSQNTLFKGIYVTQKKTERNDESTQENEYSDEQDQNELSEELVEDLRKRIKAAGGIENIQFTF